MPLLIGSHALKQEVIDRLLPPGLTVTNTASSTLALAITSGKKLTLTSTGDFNLTIPASTGLREKLSANRTYYVRTDGNDSNTGLVDSAAGAFLTIQRAVDVIANTLDIAGYTVTVQVRDGTYTGAVTLKNVIGFAAVGNLVIQGNSGTPANVIISTTNANCFDATGLNVVWYLKDMKLQTTTTGNCILASRGGKIYFKNIDFSACAYDHIRVDYGGIATCDGNYSITGGAGFYHIQVITSGAANIQGKTITLTGTPAFGLAFINANHCAAILANANTFTGGATGKRYDVSLNSSIYTAGGGENYFPGDVAGTTATGGQYT